MTLASRTGAATPGIATQFSNALDAMRDDEIASTRLFVRIGWLVAVVAIAGVLRLHGDPQLARILLLAIVTTALASVGVYFVLDTPLRPFLVTALALACVACGGLATLYCGYFSGVPLVVALGLYFFCRIANRAPAIVIFAGTGLTTVASTLAVVTGAIRDRSYAPAPPGVSLQALLVAMVGTLLTYAIAFWLARSTRAASLSAIEELQKATRLAAMRLAQVDEVRDDLDRALRVGGPGRFSNAVVGNWELGNVLGRGGMGEVYEATHVESGQPAAVKLLRRELMADLRQVERFLREVRIASALESPNVVRVLDASQPDDMVAYLAMERLRGQTLSAMLRNAAPLEHGALGDLVRQMANVLDRARSAGIVHRDIKPSNIFRTDEGVWKLLDFGVASLGSTTGTLTAEGGVIGTPGYMAPEQAKGEPVDHRSDLYTLCAVVYRTLTGRIPFTGSELSAVLYAMVQYMPIRPSGIASVSRELDRFLAIGLAKRPSDRFQSAADLANAFTAALEGQMSYQLREKADQLLAKQPWREVDTEVTRELAPKK